MRERLPFCSQNANRDENAMVMSHGAAALAGERGRGETDWGQHTECQTMAQGTGMVPFPTWDPREWGSEPTWPCSAYKQCPQEGLWGRAGDQSETQQHSPCKKSPFSQAAGPWPHSPERASPLR